MRDVVCRSTEGNNIGKEFKNTLDVYLVVNIYVEGIIFSVVVNDELLCISINWLEYEFSFSELGWHEIVLQHFAFRFDL